MTKDENEDGGSTPPASRRKPRRQLGFHEAWNVFCTWKSKEAKLAEVRRMFEKKEITNLTRIRLNQEIVNGGGANEGNALDGEATTFLGDQIDY